MARPSAALDIYPNLQDFGSRRVYDSRLRAIDPHPLIRPRPSWVKTPVPLKRNAVRHGLFDEE